MSNTQRRRFLWIFSLLGIGLIAAVAASATTLVRLQFAELVHLANAIARGRCVSVETVMERGEIWTNATFEISETAKGELPARIVIRQPGGKFLHLQSRVEGTPEFRVGEEAYLFLWGNAPHFTVLGWSQGTFRIRKNARTRKETVTQDSAQTAIFDPQTKAFTQQGVRNLGIAIFREKIQAELRRREQ